ncbi:MAG: hypothetical protein HGA85_06285, partial [Nanoarchaeota archaeon]|nr:hypothetical protein [Nanoarchaeota archaeon]
MKNGQAVPSGTITLFVIVGLLLLIMVIYAVWTGNASKMNLLSSQDKSESSDMRINVEGFIAGCIDEAIIASIADTGIREETKTELGKLTTERFVACFENKTGYFASLGYVIEKDTPITNVSITPDTISIDMTEKILFSKGGESFEFSHISRTFDRQVTKPILPRQTTIVSSDNRAILVIQNMTVSSSNKIGIKVEDKLFDSLENGVVIGNLVYDTLPEGTQFSLPIELRLRYRDIDVEDIDENTLSIAYWDEAYKIWRGLDTAISGNVAYANISHFTRYGLVRACAPLPKQTEQKISTSRLFTQRYSPCEQVNWNFISVPKITPVSPVSSSAQLPEHVSFGEGVCSSGLVEVINKRKYTYCSADRTAAKDCEQKPAGTACTSIENGVCAVTVPGECECTDDPYRKLVPWFTEEEQAEMVKGYPNPGCVGGEVNDGNGDGYIAYVDFASKGNACIHSWRYGTTCSFGDTCTASATEVPTGSNLRLAVSGFK